MARAMLMLAPSQWHPACGSKIYDEYTSSPRPYSVYSYQI